MKILFFDIEPTGPLFWKHGIHRITAIIEIDGEIKQRIDLKIQPNPAAQIDETTLALCGVDSEIIKTYTSINEGYNSFCAFLAKHVERFDKKDEKFCLAGFNNTRFDNFFLKAWFEQNRDQYFNSWFYDASLDIQVLALRYLLNERPKMSDFSLKTVAQTLMLDVPETLTAPNRVELTRAVYYSVL